MLLIQRCKIRWVKQVRCDLQAKQYPTDGQSQTCLQFQFCLLPLIDSAAKSIQHHHFRKELEIHFQSYQIHIIFFESRLIFECLIVANFFYQCIFSHHIFAKVQVSLSVYGVLKMFCLFYVWGVNRRQKMNPLFCPIKSSFQMTWNSHIIKLEFLVTNYYFQLSFQFSHHQHLQPCRQVFHCSEQILGFDRSETGILPSSLVLPQGTVPFFYESTILFPFRKQEKHQMMKLRIIFFHFRF